MSIVLDLPDADYRAWDGLSYSGAKTLMRSAAHYQHEREHGRPPKVEFDVGHAAHAEVLGVGTVVVVDAPDWRSKEARGARDELRAKGATPLLPPQAAAVRSLADAVRLHPVAGPLFAGGEAEVSIRWDDERHGVPCKARLDYLRELGGRVAGVDLKSCDDVRPERIRRAVNDHRYHWQDRFYRDALEAHDVTDPAFLFVFVERDPPHAVAVVELDPSWDEAARAHLDAARARYAACRDTGDWPGPPPEPVVIAPPPWLDRYPQETP